MTADRKHDMKLDLKSIYADAVSEDAAIAAAPVGSGEGVADMPSDAGAEVQAPDSGIKHDDVLGHCDHQHDGYLGPHCFHVPKRAGKLMRRIELLGKKKHSHKNPYAAGMRVIADAEEYSFLPFTYDEIVAALKDSAADANADVSISKIAYLPAKRQYVFKICCMINGTKMHKAVYSCVPVKDGKLAYMPSLSNAHTKEQMRSACINDSFQIVWRKDC